MGTALDVGDEGVWVTYARGMKGKAVREFTAMCEEVSSLSFLWMTVWSFDTWWVLIN